jgi:hypothetical protein
MADSDIRAPLRWPRILAVILAAFLLVEACAQLFFVVWSGKPFNSVFLYQWSPYGLVRNNPDLTGNFEISRDGFRETRTYETTKPANTFRIILVGDSVLYSGATPVNSIGDFVPSDRTISQYLSRKLRQDPAFAGINIEVINAGVNFNSMRETSASYLSDYMHWDSDFVMVFSTGNDFARPQEAGQFAARQLPLQAPHAWRGEFDRLVNGGSLSGAIERSLRQAADASAAIAIIHKGLTRSLVENDPGRYLPRFKAKSSQAGIRSLATLEEEDRYFNVYAGFASAIIGPARQLDQDVGFFWEYHLGDLDGVKPISAEERTIFSAVKRDAIARAYDKRMHDRWTRFLASHNVPAIDPIEALKKAPQTVFTDYLHYTAEGNALMADVAHAQLRDRLLERVRSRQAVGTLAK